MTDESNERFCPQCKERKPNTSFECLPLDLRCKECIPAKESHDLYDKRVMVAGQKIAQLVDAAEGGKSLRPLERMVDGIYDSWGGAAAFCQDAATWCKEMAATGKKNQALQMMAKILAIHAKVEKTRVEDDWNKLSAAEVKARLALKMAAILAEQNLEEGRKEGIRHLLDGGGME